MDGGTPHAETKGLSNLELALPAFSHSTSLTQYSLATTFPELRISMNKTGIPDLTELTFSWGKMDNK